MLTIMLSIVFLLYYKGYMACCLYMPIIYASMYPVHFKTASKCSMRHLWGVFFLMLANFSCATLYFWDDDRVGSRETAKGRQCKVIKTFIPCITGLLGTVGVGGSSYVRQHLGSLERVGNVLRCWEGAAVTAHPATPRPPLGELGAGASG